jgi:hypothetical protein
VPEWLVARLNTAQRVVVVIAMGVALAIFGRWLTSLGAYPNTGWVGYAPLRSGVSFGGLHPWVRLVVWLALTTIWAASSILVFNSPAPGGSDESAPE